MTVESTPPGFHTVTPHLVVDGIDGALAFYAAAFGAEATLRLPTPDGTVVHAELKLGDCVVMLGQASDEAPCPKVLGGTASALMIYTPDVDASYARALEAGATGQLQPTDMFWGDRLCRLEDPFGHRWTMATRTSDPSPEEIADAMKAMSSGG